MKKVGGRMVQHDAMCRRAASIRARTDWPVSWRPARELSCVPVELK